MGNNKEIWFQLFASCMVVKGASMSIISDIERNTFYDIPNEYLPILTEVQQMSIESFKSRSKFKPKMIDKFVKQFIDQEVGFFTSDIESFPKIELIWKSPYQITNAIIQIGNDNNYNVNDCIRQLEHLGCQAFQIRVESNLKIELLQKYLDSFKGTRVKYVELLIPFENNDLASLERLLKRETRLRFIKIYGSNEDRIIENQDIYLNRKILFLKKDIRTSSKEIISKDRLCNNMEVFLESQKHNVGLNRKISINMDGFIMNYIDHKEHFGNIRVDRVLDIIEKQEFQKKWFISNDKIEKCKDCQYRAACVSNSDIEVIGDLFYKKNECSFNPFTNEWV